jgi:REJ domain.
MTYGQVCIFDAGQDMVVCGGKKSGSNYRVYLDGTASSVGGSINYEWTSLDDGISFSSSQSRRAEPYFNYPQSLTQDTEFRIQLRVFDDNEVCEDFDTVLVVVQGNMCPIPDVGDDLIVSSGCESTVLLDATNSSDPDDTDLNYSWSSIDGYTSSLDNVNSSSSTFNFPDISSDQVFKFSVTVDDGENFISDTLLVTYLSNTAPLANAGDDFSTCDASFILSARKSYDVDWNSLSYSWSVLDGSINIDGASMKELTVMSPVDLDQDTDYSFELIVTETIAGEDYCSDRDTITVTIEKNICPMRCG